MTYRSLEGKIPSDAMNRKTKEEYESSSKKAVIFTHQMFER